MQLFPYMYVPYQGPMDVARSRDYVVSFASALEAALGAAMQAENPRGRQRQPAPALHNVTVVRATPYYGYHAAERPFLKIE
jgi:hypothetical protein